LKANLWKWFEQSNL